MRKHYSDCNSKRGPQFPCDCGGVPDKEVLVTTDTLKELLEILWQMNLAIGLANAGERAQLLASKMLPEIGDRIMKMKEGL